MWNHFLPEHVNRYGGVVAPVAEDEVSCADFPELLDKVDELPQGRE